MGGRGQAFIDNITAQRKTHPANAAGSVPDGWNALQYDRIIDARLSVLPLALPAQPQTAAQPNILVIMGDDVGYWNISA
jgi:hypothetical protein